MAPEKQDSQMEASQSGNGRNITIRRHDFRNVRKLSQDQRIRLGAMHSRMASALAARLEKLLNCEVEASFLGLEQVQGSNFQPADYPDVLTATLSITHAKENVYSIWPREIAFLIIERMLGGTGDGLFTEKAISDFERNILMRFGNQLVLSFKESFEERQPPETSCVSLSELMEPIGEEMPYEVLLMSRINVHIKNHQGVLIMVYPYSMAKPWIEDCDENDSQAMAASDKESKDRLIKNLGKAPVMVTVKLGSTPLKIFDFNNLQEGDCIQLNQSIDEPFDVYVENQLKYHGHMGTVGNQMGIKISEKLAQPEPGDTPQVEE